MTAGIVRTLTTELFRRPILDLERSCSAVVAARSGLAWAPRKTRLGANGSNLRSTTHFKLFITMPLSAPVFAELEFWLLIAFSLVLPPAIYWFLLSRRTIAQKTVLSFGIALVAIAGLDVYLLQRLTSLAKLNPSLVGDAIFLSEVSLALYLLPAMFGGIGINLVSHVLVNHLTDAEKKFRTIHPDPPQSV